MSDRVIVRVEDATLATDGGPVRLVLSRLRPRQVDRLRTAATVLHEHRDRVTVLVVPAALWTLADRFDEDLEALTTAIDEAVASWRVAPADLRTPAGSVALGDGPRLMGVLNVTPDSFSDGSIAYDPADHPRRAIAAGEALLAAGADIVDVGGESTRPGAAPVGVEQELARVVPVIRALARAGAVVSVDTVKAPVAAAAIDAGAAIVNDISAGRLDAALLPTVASAGVPYVLTHMQGTPQTMQHDPRYDDVVAEVFEQLATDRDRAVACGIDPASILVDPGIGFGKTLRHNTALLGALRSLTSLGHPVLVGTSRKSFIGRLTGIDDPGERLEGSLASAALAAADGAAVLRVHDVEATRRALAVARAIAVERPGAVRAATSELSRTHATSTTTTDDPPTAERGGGSMSRGATP
ncbi:MAG: dihydropteroate synthase [Nitriliruptoraceae bacterium]|nr:dihydropteroate synthase [Nitriliruptoraceae bacterium]